MNKILAIVVVMLISGCANPEWYDKEKKEIFTRDGCQWVRGQGSFTKKGQEWAIAPGTSYFHYEGCTNSIHKK